MQAFLTAELTTAEAGEVAIASEATSNAALDTSNAANRVILKLPKEGRAIVEVMVGSDGVEERPRTALSAANSKRIEISPAALTAIRRAATKRT